MRIQRVVTKQGHAVPSSSHAPRGPFPPELFREPEMISDYTPIDDDVPIGGTAQNNFRAPKLFRCKSCSVLVLEYELDEHVCPEAEDSSGEDS
jgi:hypothetical protein